MVLDSRRQKARKTHRCRECLGTIEVGEVYTAFFDVDNKKGCNECSDCGDLIAEIRSETPAEDQYDWADDWPGLRELCEEEPFRSKFLAIVEKRRKWEPRPIGKSGPRAFIAEAKGCDLPHLIVRAESAKEAKTIACLYWRNEWHESWEIIMVCRIKRSPSLDDVQWKGAVCEDEKVMRDTLFCCYGEEGEPCEECHRHYWPGVPGSAVEYVETSSRMLCAECRAKEENNG